MVVGALVLGWLVFVVLAWSFAARRIRKDRARTALETAGTPSGRPPEPLPPATPRG